MFDVGATDEGLVAGPGQHNGSERIDRRELTQRRCCARDEIRV